MNSYWGICNQTITQSERFWPDHFGTSGICNRVTIRNSFISTLVYLKIDIPNRSVKITFIVMISACYRSMLWSDVSNYNMTVWILREMTSIFPWQRVWLGYIYARRQVISCVTKASACHHTLHANHWHCLRKIPPMIADKRQRHNFHSSSQIPCKYILLWQGCFYRI